MISNLSQREEYLRKKKNKKLFKYGVILFSVVLIIGIFSYISHRPQIRISKVELSGGVLVTQGDVNSATLSYISGSYLWLFPKNNAFLYPHNGLEKYLKETFKRIDTVNAHLKDFKTLTIDITERKPVATWCDVPPNTTPIENSIVPEEHCYFIDQNSTIFAEAPEFSGDAYFKYYGAVSGETPIGKEYIASSTEFGEISDFVAKTKLLSLKPLYLIAKDDGGFSLFIAGGGEIMFDMREPLSLAGQNLEVLLRTPALATSSTGNLPIDYIDLRYGNKLFYKLK